MKKLTLLAFAILAVIIVSCSKEAFDMNATQESTDFLENPDLVCSISESKDADVYDPETGTKTTLTMNDSDQYEITWDANDEIAVTDGTNLAYYTSISAGQRQSKFVCKRGDKLDLTKELIAAFPSNLIKKDESNKVYYSMNVVNEVGDITNIHIYPMMAKGGMVNDEIKLVFRNLASIVRFKVSRNNLAFTDPININSLEVNTDKAVAGEFEVDWGVDEGGVSVPQIKMSADESKTSKVIKFTGFNNVLPETGTVILTAAIAPETYSTFNAVVGVITHNTTSGISQSGKGYIKMKSGKTINLARSNYYDITKKVHFDFIDLSPAAATNYRNCTGNCLMISQPGAVNTTDINMCQYYSFSVLNTGNHFWKQFGSISNLKNSNIKDEDWNNMVVHNDDSGHADDWVVEIIWQDRYNDGKPLIQFLGTEYGELSVTYHGFQNCNLRAVAYGNTVIGIRKVINGVKQPYSWSYHVWAFDGAQDALNPFFRTHAYYDETLSAGPSMMRLNLGAISAAQPQSAGNPDECGLFYQWGRKDPFPHPDHFYRANVDEGTITKQNFEVETLPAQCKNQSGIWVSVTHPGRFYSDWADVYEIKTYSQAHLGDVAYWIENNNWTFDQPGTDPNFKQPLFEPSSLGTRVPNNSLYKNTQFRCSSAGNYYKFLVDKNVEEIYPKDGYLGSNGQYNTDNGNNIATYYWTRALANSNPTAWAQSLCTTSTSWIGVNPTSNLYKNINPSRACHIRLQRRTPDFDPRTYKKTK